MSGPERCSQTMTVARLKATTGQDCMHRQVDGDPSGSCGWRMGVFTTIWDVMLGEHRSQVTAAGEDAGK